MKEINLNNRLKTIVDLLGPLNIVVDVGCDHGYVANYLVENNLSHLVYATDISGPSLMKNKEFAYNRGNDQKVISVLGDGLQPLKDKEFNGIIIAGMGGDLIIKILDEAKDFIEDKTLVLQPMTAKRDLRIYLYENGFSIIREELVRDGDKFYEIIKAQNGKVQKPKWDFYFGENLIEEKNPVLKEYLEFLIKKTNGFIQNASKSKSLKAQERIKELEEEKKIYEGVLNEFNS